MHHIDIRGDYKEMGRQQAPPLTGWQLPPAEPKLLRFARQCEALIAYHAPELLQEIQGIAESASLDYDALLAFTITIPFDPQDVHGCTVLALAPERTADGRPIVGRNYDFFHDTSEEPATTYRTYPRDGMPAWAIVTFG